MVGAHVNLAENFHFANKQENTRILDLSTRFEFLRWKKNILLLSLRPFGLRT